MRYSCRYCPISSDFLAIVTQHQSSKHEGYLYECDIDNCNKAYKWEIDLRRHKERHKNLDFNCDVCEKKFLEKRFLSRHFREQHLRIKRKCKYEGCEYQTITNQK